MSERTAQPARIFTERTRNKIADAAGNYGVARTGALLPQGFDDAALIDSMSKTGRGIEEEWALAFEKDVCGTKNTVQSLLVSKNMPMTAAYAANWCL